MIYTIGEILILLIAAVLWACCSDGSFGAAAAVTSMPNASSAWPMPKAAWPRRRPTETQRLPSWRRSRKVTVLPRHPPTPS